MSASKLYLQQHTVTGSSQVVNQNEKGVVVTGISGDKLHICQVVVGLTLEVNLASFERFGEMQSRTQATDNNRDTTNSIPLDWKNRCQPRHKSWWVND